MTRYLALFLSVYLFAGSLIPGNSFFELSEIPAMVQHYQYHRNIETPQISFIEFLAMHYDDPRHENSDPVHHRKLPMHHRGISAPADEIVYSEECKNLTACLNLPVTIFFNEINISITDPKTTGVFRPPNSVVFFS